MSAWNISAVLCSVLLSVSCVFAQSGGGCKVKEPRTASVDAAGARLVRVQGAAGWLKIRGAGGASTLEIDGEACAANRKKLAEIELVAERRGDEVVIEARIPSGWRDGGALDLDVVVPADLAIVARDGSGAVEVRGVASLELRDGSGGVEIEDVAGDVRVQDGSGGIDISNVDGSVTVSDGSGGIEIRQVGEGVLVERDGSGGIRVRDVGGDFVVERDGSGGVSSERIAGATRVPK